MSTTQKLVAAFLKQVHQETDAGRTPALVEPICSAVGIDLAYGHKILTYLAQERLVEEPEARDITRRNLVNMTVKGAMEAEKNSKK
jgi:hypothetical protein